MFVACGGDNGQPRALSVQVEVVEQDAPVAVEATGVSKNESGEFQHGVRVTWTGAQTARLDDARFTHHVESGEGDLVTVGRGCGASWDEESEELLLACTADLQLILLEPGQSHDYPVRIPMQVGPLKLKPGTYVVEEPIHWWLQEAIDAEPTGEGEFTIRLTYDVE